MLSHSVDSSTLGDDEGLAVGGSNTGVVGSRDGLAVGPGVAIVGLDDGLLE